MGKLSPLIWQSTTAFDHHTDTPTPMPPNGHRTLREGDPHSVHFMGCTSCVEYHTYHHMSRPHSAHFTGVYFMGCISCADDPTHDYHMPDSVALHSMNPPYIVCSPLVYNSECMRDNRGQSKQKRPGPKGGRMGGNIPG